MLLEQDNIATIGAAPVPIPAAVLSPTIRVCQVYQADAERDAVLAAFLNEGAARGERCLYVTAELPAPDTAASLPWMGAVEVSVAMAVYGKDGRFHTPTAIAWLQQQQQQAYQQGFTGLRVAADMRWVLHTPTYEEALIAHETQFEPDPTLQTVSLLCQFNQDDFPRNVLAKLLTIHAYIVIGAQMYHNQFVVPHAQLSAPLSAPWDGYQPYLEQVRLWWRQQENGLETAVAPPPTNAASLLTTEREQRLLTETKLRQLSQAVEQSPVSIIITDLHGNIEHVNQQFTTITGYTAAEVLGKNPRILKSGHTSPDEYEQMWQTIVHGDVWRGEFHNRAKDGRLYWEYAAISPIKNEADAITHFLAVEEDVTDVKELANALRQRNRELQLLNHASRDLNSTLALDKVLQIMLEEIRRLLNVDACSVWLLDADTQELVCHQVTDPQGNIVHGWRLQPGQGIAGYAALHGNSVIVSDALHDDRHYPLIDARTGLQLRSILTTPLRTKQGIIGVFQIVDERPHRFTLNDQALMESLAAIAANAIENAQLHEDLQQQLTTLQNTQAQLLQHEKLAAIGELVAGVAHELNNPLTSIMLYTQLLQRKSPFATEAEQELNKILQQTRHATSIVRSLLDFARQHPPERVTTQVNEIVTAVFELLAYELRMQNVEWHLELAPELPPILVDTRQILQVLVNLINNAIYAMRQNEKGRVLFVTTQLGASQFATITTPGAPHCIRIAIQDNGSGIPRNLQTRIFDPFFTTKPAGEGTGLGLSVCHGIISEHGGHIWVNSKPGHGATFYIELPVTTAVENDDAMTDGPPSLTDTVTRILIIDDEASIREILHRALQRERYLVDSAADGAAGIACLQQRSYNLVICDMRMPQVDGTAVYQYLQTHQPHLLPYFIFTTGDEMTAGTSQFLQQTGAPCLAKPFDLSDIKRLICEKLQAQGKARP